MDRFFREFENFFSDDFFNDFFNNKRLGKADSSTSDVNYNKEEGEYEDGSKWVNETWRDGKSIVSRTYITMNPKVKSKESKEDLQRALDLAVEEERYEDAAKIRDKIKSL